MARILLLGNDPTHAGRVRRTLAESGFEVEWFTTPDVALARLEQGGIAAALIDLTAPELNGYEVCRSIRQNGATAGVPVALIADLTELDAIVRVLANGADLFIAKPCTDEVLLKRVQKLLDARRHETDAPLRVRVEYDGQCYDIQAGVDRILDYLLHAVEDFDLTAQHDGAAQRANRTHPMAEALLRARGFLQATLDALVSRIAILDADGTIVATNQAWRDSPAPHPLVGDAGPLGVSYLDVCDRAWRSGMGVARQILMGVRHRLEGEWRPFRAEYAITDPDGGMSWYTVRITRFSGAGPARVVVAHDDVTDLKTAQEKLRHTALHDTLTGLPNRALLLERLERVVLRAQREPDYEYALLYLDLDRFKRVNDSLGHLAGDKLLVESARRLDTCVRAVDTAARLGGDEFCVLLENLDHPRHAVAVAERIQRALSQPIELEGTTVAVSASIGIAYGNASYDAPLELLRDADAAMYRAKELGKAQHVVFDEAMHAEAMRQLELEAHLRRTLDDGGFEFRYLPAIDLRTGAITQVEALVRLRMPDGRLAGPGEFIGLAEETGLILPMGSWCIREACRQLRAWRDAGLFPGEPRVSVNLSPRQFWSTDLIRTVEEAITRYDVHPRQLDLEVNAPVLTAHPDKATEVLRELKQRGVGLSLDDFGTDYSAIGYLRTMAFDHLKVDRSFIAGIVDHPRDQEIVRAMVSMCEALGTVVVAEGVETAEQLEVVRELGCHEAQGWYFARPQTADGLAAFVQGWEERRARGRLEHVVVDRLS